MSEKPSIYCCSRFVVGLAVLAAALMLKNFYSGAGSEELAWIVGPIAFLLEVLTDFSFVREAGFGWVDFDHNIVIAPPCAGVNFLIMAFCMSSFLMLGRGGSIGRMITTIVLVGFASYVVTVIACTTRILFSVHAFRLDIYSGWLTQGAVHRAVGVCIYYLFLSFYFHLVYSFCPYKKQACERTGGAGASMRKWFVFFTPLFCYLTFSLGVPFINGAYRADHDSFLWHALGVGSVSVLLTLMMLTAYYFVNVLKNVCRA